MSRVFPFVLGAVVAALPGTVILQVLPRIATSEAAGGTLAVMAVVLPPLGALVGGLLLRLLAPPSGSYGPMMGMASQLPALPGYLTLMSDMVAATYVLDAGAYTVLFGSYVVIGATLADVAANRGREDGNVFPGAHAKRWWAQVAGIIVCFVTALAMLGNIASPLLYPLFVSVAGLCLATYATLGRTGWQLRTGQVLLIAMAGAMVFTLVVLVGSTMV